MNAIVFGLRLIKHTIYFQKKKNELEWCGKVTSTNKQYKIGQRNAYYCAKSWCSLSLRPYLDMLTKTDVPEDIKIGMETEFVDEHKVAEHK